MTSTYSVTQAQRNLPRLIRKAEEGHPVGILRYTEAVAYFVSRERMEAILEKLALLSNPKATKAIDAHRAGKMEQ